MTALPLPALVNTIGRELAYIQCITSTVFVPGVATGIMELIHNVSNIRCYYIYRVLAVLLNLCQDIIQKNFCTASGRHIIAICYGQ